MSEKVRVRFAPSPTGHIHVGNVRTALFNYLFSKGQGGDFILRIEDTDLERSTQESEDLIYEDLEWLGLKYDEGPKVGGDYGPYRQTERFQIYNDYAAKLIEEGYAYKCFCTKEELDKGREEAQKAGRAYIYPGTCAHLSKEEVASREANGEKAAIRFKAFKPTILVKDLIHGEIDFPTNAFGDFIIIRPDGTPIYNYVVVIDDALMKITHVIRGDDHLSNTPKQALIYEALGMKSPTFAHIPMILGPDHTKLSKRHGNTSIEEFRKQGYLRDALINYMALLSWSSENEKEIFSLEELIKEFSISRVSKSAAVFDFDKLKWMNGIYIRNMAISSLLKECEPFLIEAALLTKEEIDKNRSSLEAMLLSIRDNLTLLNEAPSYMKIYFSLPDIITDEAKEILALDSTKPVQEAFIEKILAEGGEYLELERYRAIMKEIQKELGVKGKPLYMAVRTGVTRSTQGPEMDSVCTLLPVSELERRIRETIKEYYK